MAYIGNSPALKYASFAVQHFTTSATTSYSLDNSVANENDIALFVNNVRQQPGSSYAYTAAGTTLTLSAATTTSDTMYCVFIGKAVQTVTPPVNSVGTSQLVADSVTQAKMADDSVGTAEILDTNVTGAKLNTDVISAQTALAVAPADTDEFMVSDGGVLKRIDYSLIKGGGKILGYQYSTDTANRSGTAGSEVVTGLTFAYTPSAATSRLLICMNVPTTTTDASTSAIRVKFRVRTGTTTGGTELLSAGFGTYQSGGTLVHQMDALQTYNFIHHPNTTSAQDYCLTVQDNSGTSTWKVSGCDNSYISAISILEIDGS